jgi:hypothetical protein
LIGRTFAAVMMVLYPQRLAGGAFDGVVEANVDRRRLNRSYGFLTLCGGVIRALPEN